MVNQSHNTTDTTTFQIDGNDGSPEEPDARDDVESNPAKCANAVTPRSDDDGNRTEPESRESVTTQPETRPVFKNGKQYAARRHVKFNGPEEFIGAYWPAWLKYTPPMLQLEPP